MTKADIVNEISKSTGIDKANVLETIEKFMETVKESLSHGENVYLRGFGSFITKVRSERLPVTYQRTPLSSSPNTASPLSSPPRCLWKRLRI